MSAGALKTTTFDSALVIADMRGIIVAINDRCSDMFGYTSSELIGKPLHFMMPSPYKEQHQSYVRRYLSAGVPKMIGHARNVQGQHKDGTVFPLLLAVKQVRHDSIVLFHGFMKKLEDPSAYISVDVETKRILTANMQTIRIFGYDLTELSQMLYSDLLTEDSREMSLLAEEQYGLPRNLTGRQKNGATFPVSLIVDAGEIPGQVSVRMEKVHHKVEAVATVTENGIIESCNDGFLPILGYRKDELIGQNVSILMPSPYREHHDAYMTRYLSTREPHIVGRGKRLVHARHKDGSEFPIWLDVNEWERAGRSVFSGIITRVRDEEATVAVGQEVIQTKLTYVGEYLVCDTLGKGYSASVKLGRHQRTGHSVALKIMRKNERWDAERVALELSLMQSLQHPNIAKVYELVETPEYWCLVLEYASEGDLCNLMERSRGPLSEAVARVIFRQLAGAIAYLHGVGVVHRDIKLENVLLDARGGVRLIDFGLSARVRPGELLETMCGTPNYSAPQLLLAQPYEGPPADVWSMGVLLYCMLSAAFPFSQPQAIVDGMFKPLESLSAEVNDLIRRMLCVAVADRATIQDVLRHPWLAIDVNETIDWSVGGPDTVPRAPTVSSSSGSQSGSRTALPTAAAAPAAPGDGTTPPPAKLPRTTSAASLPAAPVPARDSAAAGAGLASIATGTADVLGTPTGRCVMAVPLTAATAGTVTARSSGVSPAPGPAAGKRAHDDDALDSKRLCTVSALNVAAAGTSAGASGGTAGGASGGAGVCIASEVSSSWSEPSSASADRSSALERLSQPSAAPLPLGAAVAAVGCPFHVPPSSAALASAAAPSTAVQSRPRP